MNEIEIYIDESGDFGPFDERCPYYIVTMVFHETLEPLFACIQDLEYRLSLLGLEDHCIHSSPAIRGEGEYYGMDKGQKLLSQLITRTFQSRFANVRLTRVLPVHSRLFQAADFFCTIQRMLFRLGASGSLSKAEMKFFGTVSNFQKNWVKPFRKCEWR